LRTPRLQFSLQFPAGGIGRPRKTGVSRGPTLCNCGRGSPSQGRLIQSWGPVPPLGGPLSSRHNGGMSEGRLRQECPLRGVCSDTVVSRGQKGYNGAMGIQVNAVYENGVLKPLQPLGLAEHEHVSVTVIKAASAPGSPQLDFAYLESLQIELLHAGPAPGIEEVRRRLSKIPGSMTGDFIADREDR